MRIVFATRLAVAGIGDGTTEKILLYAADQEARSKLLEAGGEPLELFAFPANSRRKILELIEAGNQSRKPKPKADRSEKKPRTKRVPTANKTTKATLKSSNEVSSKYHQSDSETTVKRQKRATNQRQTIGKVSVK